MPTALVPTPQCLQLGVTKATLRMVEKCRSTSTMKIQGRHWRVSFTHRSFKMIIFRGQFYELFLLNHCFYRKYAKAETLMTVTDAVHDIAFAPNLGRSFHVLAIATKDVRIFKLVPIRCLIPCCYFCIVVCYVVNVQL